MAAAEKMFTGDKAMVLNAVYDALDAISLVIDGSNSLCGTLTVSSAVFPELGGRIEVLPDTGGAKTLVRAFPGTEDGEQPEWIDALFDEILSLIIRSRTEVRE